MHDSRKNKEGSSKSKNHPIATAWIDINRSHHGLRTFATAIYVRSRTWLSDDGRNKKTQKKRRGMVKAFGTLTGHALPRKDLTMQHTYASAYHNIHSRERVEFLKNIQIVFNLNPILNWKNREFPAFVDWTRNAWKHAFFWTLSWKTYLFATLQVFNVSNLVRYCYGFMSSTSVSEFIPRFLL